MISFLEAVSSFQVLLYTFLHATREAFSLELILLCYPGQTLLSTIADAPRMMLFFFTFTGGNRSYLWLCVNLGIVSTTFTLFFPMLWLISFYTHWSLLSWRLEEDSASSLVLCPPNSGYLGWILWMSNSERLPGSSWINLLVPRPRNSR